MLEMFPVKSGTKEGCCHLRFSTLHKICHPKHENEETFLKEL